MPKPVRCADLMPGCTCPFAVEGSDVDELLATLAEHARNDHGMPGIPPEMVAEIRTAIGRA